MSLKRIAIALVAVGSLCVAGCAATLAVKRIEPLGSDAEAIRAMNAPVTGVIDYYLPRTVITLQGTATLISCTDPDGVPHMNVEVKAAPVVSTEPNPRYHYEIDLGASRSWRHSVAITVASQSGYLQSFNGAVADQVGPDAVAALGTLVQIGGAVAIGLAGQPGIVSNQEVAAAAAAAAAGKGQHVQSVHVAPQGCRGTVIAELRHVDGLLSHLREVEDEHPKTVDALTLQAHEIGALQAKVTSYRLEQHLTRPFAYRWIPHAADDTIGDSGRYLVFARHVLLTPVIAKWLTPVPNGMQSYWPSGLGRPMLMRLYVDPRTAGVSIPRASHAHTTKDEALRAELNQPGGLVVLEPATAILTVCQMAPGMASTCAAAGPQPANNRTVDTTEDIGKRVVIPVAQLGRVAIFPEEDGLFDSDTLAVTLNSDGTLASVSDNTSSAMASGITSIGTAASNAQGALAARATEISAVNTANQAVSSAQQTQMEAPDTFNKTLADCLTQAAAVTAAGGKPMPCQ